jgi:hypothetical protein
MQKNLDLNRGVVARSQLIRGKLAAAGVGAGRSRFAIRDVVRVAVDGCLVRRIRHASGSLTQTVGVATPQPNGQTFPLATLDAPRRWYGAGITHARGRAAKGVA